MAIDAVYFDIGETIVDRRREYAAIARGLGVSPHTFSAVFGAVIAAGGDIDDVFDRFGVTRAGARRLATVAPLAEIDLYPDARAALARLHDAGLRVGVVGNQPGEITTELRALELPVDDIATSADWGVAKPDPGFFEQVVASAGAPPERIVYIGDQLDKDVVPALTAGLQAARIVRGPWGALFRDAPVEARCVAVADDLGELAELLLARRH